MSIWVFCLAAFLSLPKQFVTVYIGVALEQSENGGSDKKDNIIKDVVLVITGFVTVAALWYIHRKMNEVKPAVIYARRKARQGKMQRANLPFSNVPVGESSTSIFNPQSSESNLPLTSNADGYQHQQWDSQGHAVGFSGDPTLYAPQPKRPASRIPAVSSSQPSSRTTTADTASPPSMSERTFARSPPRQNVANTPWKQPDSDDAYQPTGIASVYDDPFYDSAHSPPSSTQPLNLRKPKSPVSAIPPVNQPALPPARAPYPRSSSPSQQATPTQAQFPSYVLPPYQPSNIPLTMSPPPIQPSGGHAAEATDASFYTAHGGHPRPGTDDPYTAYDSEDHSLR